MRASRDTSAVTAELAQLATTVRGADTARIASGVEAHVSGLSAHARLYFNAVRMLSALAADQVEELHRLRGEHRELLQAARGILGRAEVAEHVRAAWAATRDHWTGERIQRMAAETATRIVSRQVSAEFRALLAESLARQMQLNELATRAAHGQLSRSPGTGVTPARTRVGAGVLAAIEIVRIGLDVANQAHEASLAADASAARSARTGMATANWWLRRGVTPTLALTEQSAWSGKYDVVSDDLDQASIQQAAFSETAAEGTPEFEMVVVEDVERDEVVRLVRAWVVALGTLEDWHDANLGPTGPMFERFSNGWGVRLWSREKKQYSYFHLPELDNDLDRLHEALSKSQADVLDLDVLEAGEGAVRTVEDTAWFGVDREMYVYNERGCLEELDFEDEAPRLLVLSAPQYVGLAGEEMTLVKAADMATYRRLSGYWWRHYTGQTSISQSGIHHEYVIEPNSKAKAWVRPDEVISDAGTKIHETVVRARQPELAASVPER
jgi:hypothetical protein